jgi:hypothetical protein
MPATNVTLATVLEKCFYLISEKLSIATKAIKIVMFNEEQSVDKFSLPPISIDMVYKCTFNDTFCITEMI